MTLWRKVIANLCCFLAFYTDLLPNTDVFWERKILVRNKGKLLSRQVSNVLTELSTSVHKKLFTATSTRVRKLVPCDVTLEKDEFLLNEKHCPNAVFHGFAGKAPIFYGCT